MGYGDCVLRSHPFSKPPHEVFLLPREANDTTYPSPPQYNEKPSSVLPIRRVPRWHNARRFVSSVNQTSFNRHPRRFVKQTNARLGTL